MVLEKFSGCLRLEIGLPPNFYRVEELVKFTFYDLQVSLILYAQLLKSCCR